MTFWTGEAPASWRHTSHGRLQAGFVERDSVSSKNERDRAVKSAVVATGFVRLINIAGCLRCSAAPRALQIAQVLENMGVAHPIGSGSC